MPSGQGAGTTPIHNKQKKKAKKEEDDDEIAAKQKRQAEAKAQKDMTDKLKAGGKLGKGLAYGNNANKKK